MSTTSIIKGINNFMQKLKTSRKSEYVPIRTRSDYYHIMFNMEKIERQLLELAKEIDEKKYA